MLDHKPVIDAVVIRDDDHAILGLQEVGRQRLTGQADRVVPHRLLIASAVEWAAELGGGNSSALALSKAIIDQTFELTADQAFALGAQAQAICYTTDEHHAAVAAFLNRRPSTEHTSAQGPV